MHCVIQAVRFGAFGGMTLYTPYSLLRSLLTANVGSVSLFLAPSRYRMLNRDFNFADPKIAGSGLRMTILGVLVCRQFESLQGGFRKLRTASLLEVLRIRIAIYIYIYMQYIYIYRGSSQNHGYPWGSLYYRL